MEQRATILELPIFPLKTVLFPGMPLPLHIFEERYKQMIGRCLEGDRAFGVTLLKSGREVGGPATPYEIGTIARIVRAVKFDDGRYDLRTRGASRYHILDSRYESGYLTARVELLDEDEEDLTRLAALRATVEDHFEQYFAELAEITGTKLDELSLPDDPTATSYFVAHYLPVYAWEKQRLLEATSSDLRLQEELRLLRRERGMIREFGALPPIYQVDDNVNPRLVLN
jgi:Lon protease-like protein